jgi:hypothetical protein
MKRGDSGKEWKLPTDDQITRDFISPIIMTANVLIYQEMIKRGWYLDGFGETTVLNIN